MCFYDQHRMACECYKWGHFRQHCAKEYRTGETCGMRLVMATYQSEDKCRLCTKIETKKRAARKEDERIRRWHKEGGRHASIEKSQRNIDDLHTEIWHLENEKLCKRSGTI